MTDSASAPNSASPKPLERSTKGAPGVGIVVDVVGATVVDVDVVVEVVEVDVDDDVVDDCAVVVTAIDVDGMVEVDGGVESVDVSSPPHAATPTERTTKDNDRAASRLRPLGRHFITGVLHP